jgi:hypothetical protein
VRISGRAGAGAAFWLWALLIALSCVCAIAGRSLGQMPHERRPVLLIDIKGAIGFVSAAHLAR